MQLIIDVFKGAFWVIVCTGVYLFGRLDGYRLAVRKMSLELDYHRTLSLYEIHKLIEQNSLKERSRGRNPPQ